MGSGGKKRFGCDQVAFGELLKRHEVGLDSYSELVFPVQQRVKIVEGVNGLFDSTGSRICGVCMMGIYGIYATEEEERTLW
jgi:hypothetical protein